MKGNLIGNEPKKENIHKKGLSNGPSIRPLQNTNKAKYLNEKEGGKSQNSWHYTFSAVLNSSKGTHSN